MRIATWVPFAALVGMVVSVPAFGQNPPATSTLCAECPKNPVFPNGPGLPAIPPCTTGLTRNCLNQPSSPPVNEVPDSLLPQPPDPVWCARWHMQGGLVEPGVIETAMPATGDCEDLASGGTWTAWKQVPCIDDDSDGEIYLEDDDEDKTPFDSGDPMSIFNDNDGDGMPNYYDNFPNGFPPEMPTVPGDPYYPINPTGLWEGGQVPAGDLVTILQTLGVEVDVNSLPVAFGDLNADGDVTTSEIATQMFEAIQAAYADYLNQFDQETVPLNDFIEANADLHGLAQGTYFLLLPQLPDLLASPSGRAALAFLEAVIKATGDTITNIIVELEGAGLDINDIQGDTTELVAILSLDADGSPGMTIAYELPDLTTYDPGDGTDTPFDEQWARNLSTTGDPVDTASGEFKYHATDFELSGRGLDLRIERHYLSRATHRGMVGHNWSMPLLETRIEFFAQRNPGAEHHIAVIWGDGRVSLFRQKSTTGPEAEIYEGISGEFGKVRLDTTEDQLCAGSYGQPGFELRDPNGTRYLFCPPIVYAGHGLGLVSWLRKVMDPYGNAIVISRNDWGEVTKIVDTLGRQLQFTFDSDLHLLKEITDWSGRKVTYTHDAITLDLLRVDKPTTVYLDDTDAVQSGRRYEAYTYAPHPSGLPYQQMPEPHLNHNLVAIDHGGGISVQVQYYTLSNYSWDKVYRHTVAGDVTEYIYSSIPASAPPSQQDPLDPRIRHVTEAHYATGEIERFLHGSQAQLYRHEILNTKGDPGANVWATIYDYDSDFRLVSQLETNDLDYPNGRRTTTVYDTTSPDRLAHGNAVQIVHYPFPVGAGPSQLVYTIVYDPITNRPASVTDPIGRTHTRYFGHQEASYSTVLLLPLVADWFILPPTPLNPQDWGLGDINQDQVVGGTYEIVKCAYPEITVEDPEGPGGGTLEVPEELWAFNAFGQQISHIDTGGKKVAYGYVGGQIGTVTVDPDTLALTSTQQWDSVGRVSVTFDPNGRNQHFKYDSNDNLIEEWIGPPASNATPIPVPVRLKTTYFYDRAGRYVGFEDNLQDKKNTPYGAGTTPRLRERRHYDSAGRVVVQDERVYHGTQLFQEGTSIQEWDGRSRLTSVTSPIGGQTINSYDSRGQLVIQEEIAGGTSLGQWLVEYDDYGNRTKVTAPVWSDPSGPDTHNFAYDGYQRLVEYIAPDLLKTNWDRDAVGRALVETQRDQAGSVVKRTSVQYDAMDRVTRTDAEHFALQGGIISPVVPSPIVTLTGWGSGGLERLWTVVDPTGVNRLTGTQYDGAWRVTGELVGSNDELGTFFTYDDSGLLLTKRSQLDARGSAGPVSPSDVVETRAYNGYKRLRFLTDGTGASWEYAYNARGDITKVTDPDGLVTTYTHDSRGRQLTITDTAPDGLTRTSSLEYDILGNTTASVDARQNRTEYEVDQLGRRITRRFPTQTEESFYYDSLSRLTVQNLPGGIVRTYEYDPAGRLESLAATGANAGVTRTYGWDALGNLESLTDAVTGRPSVTVFRSNDSRGLMLREFTQLGSWSADVSASYDASELLVGMTYPSGMSLARHYDGLGRPTKVTVGGFGDVVVNAIPYGRTYRRAALLDGATLEQEFDARGRRVERKSKTSAASNLLGGTFQYSATGDLISRTNVNVAASESLAYDGFHRLTQCQVGTRTVSWWWDLTDNLDLVQDSSAGVLDPSANSLNQIVSASPTTSSLTYRPSGEELGRTTVTGSYAWQWDALGRPLTLTFNAGQGPQTIWWAFDGFDRLVSRTSTTEPPRYYAWFGGQALQCEDSAVGTTEYFYGLDADEIAFAVRDSSAWLYVQEDPFGNVEGSHSAASVLEAIVYEPFGLPRNAYTGAELVNGSVVGIDLLYQGQPYDHAARLSRFGARTYDPLLARFVSRDPLRESAGTNLYAYAAANPFRWSDPLGLSAADTQKPTSATPGVDEDAANPFGVIFGQSPLSVLDKYIATNYDRLGLEAPRHFLELGLLKAMDVLLEARKDTKAHLDYFAGYSNHSSGEKKAIQALEKGLRVLEGMLATGALKGVDVAVSLPEKAAAAGLKAVGVPPAIADPAAAVGGFFVGGVGAKGLQGLIKLARGADAVGDTVRTVRAVGQQHHAISRTIHNALERHPNLAGRYAARDSRFVTQAIDDAAHRGYQTWHRELDQQVVGWIQVNPNASPAEFEGFLRELYATPDLASRFPGGF